MTSSFQHQFTSLAPYYDELMAHVPYSYWVDYVLKICKRYKHRPQRVLDCACGTGNVTYELARRGFEAVGVDFSEEMIEVARHKSTFVKGTRQPQFFQADLCEMELDRQFDTVTCLYDSLNYLTTPQLLQKAFEQINKHLRPGGLFIFDMNAPYAFETDMFTQSDRRPRQKLHYDWVAHYDRQTRLCQVQMTYTRRMEDGGTARFKEIHCERSYTMDEIRECLHAAGWRLLECFDSYRLAPPHAESERWFFVASDLKERKG
jgi:SAM-dependent methyltransferase